MVVQVALIAVLINEEKENECIEGKKTWVRLWIKNRQEFGAFHTLNKEMELDQQAFKEYFRVDKTQFKTLLEKVYWQILK